MITRQNIQTTSSWTEISPTYRNYWQQRYGNQGGRWEDYEPVYQYTWQMHNNPQYQGRSWTQVERDLRLTWETRYPDQPWDRVGTMIQETWSTDVSGQPVQADVANESVNINMPIQRD